MRVNLQKMRRPITALLLLVQLLVALLPAQGVQAAGLGSLAGSLAGSLTGSLSGRVFVDGNGSGFVEPGEAAVAFATVYVQLQGAAGPAVEVTADAQGVFVLRDLDYGVYEVWAEGQGKVARRHALVEIAEVNAAVLLDLPVYESVGYNSTVADGLLFLPLLKS